MSRPTGYIRIEAYLLFGPTSVAEPEPGRELLDRHLAAQEVEDCEHRRPVLPMGRHPEDDGSDDECSSGRGDYGTVDDQADGSPDSNPSVKIAVAPRSPLALSA